MKHLKFLALFVFALTFTYTLNSCGSKADQKSKTEQTGKEYTSDYICPMHCEGSGSDKPGTCPVCEMDYVANKDKKNSDHDGHDHDDHDGHDH